MLTCSVNSNARRTSVFLWVLFRFMYFWMFNTLCHMGAPYSMMLCIALHCTVVLLVLGPPTFGIILVRLASVFLALSVTASICFTKAPLSSIIILWYLTVFEGVVGTPSKIKVTWLLCRLPVNITTYVLSGAEVNLCCFIQMLIFLNICWYFPYMKLHTYINIKAIDLMFIPELMNWGLF